MNSLIQWKNLGKTTTRGGLPAKAPCSRAAEQGRAPDREASGCDKNPPVTPLGPQKERLYSRQLDWLAEQGGAPDREALGCAKNPPVTPLATPKREWVRYQSVFCICVFASNPVQEKKFLFFVFKIPYDDSYFSVFYPSQIKAY